MNSTFTCLLAICTSFLCDFSIYLILVCLSLLSICTFIKNIVFARNAIFNMLSKCFAFKFCLWCFDIYKSHSVINLFLCQSLLSAYCLFTSLYISIRMVLPKRNLIMSLQLKIFIDSSSLLGQRPNEHKTQGLSNDFYTDSPPGPLAKVPLHSNAYIASCDSLNPLFSGLLAFPCFPKPPSWLWLTPSNSLCLVNSYRTCQGSLLASLLDSLVCIPKRTWAFTLPSICYK